MNAIIDFFKGILGVLHWGLNMPVLFRTPGKRVVIFSNKYRCENPREAPAWLVVDKWKKTYIYPFSNMEYCLCESKSLLYNHAIFNNERVPIRIGGYGFRSGLCKEVGLKFLREYFNLEPEEIQEIENGIVRSNGKYEMLIRDF
jgi:hypothetical protein